jgi:hypothetical protein
MNPDLFLVFPFIIVVTAIVMGVIGKVTKHAMDLRHKEKMMHFGAAAPATQVTAQLAEMEQRLRVLERIATEDRQGTTLAAEIEALRSENGLGNAGTPLVMPATRIGENVQ